MSKNTFSEVLELETKKIKKIQSNMNKTKQGPLFVKEVQNLIKMLELTHPEELEAELNSMGAFSALEKAISTVEDKIELVKSHNLDMATQKLTLNLTLDNKPIEIKTKTVQEIIKDKFQMKESSPLYFLVMSFLMNEQIFETFQLEMAVARL